MMFNTPNIYQEGGMRFSTGVKLVAAVAAVSLLAGCSGPRSAPRAFEEAKCTPDVAWPALDQALSDEILRLTNEHRRSIGAGPLAIDPSLQRAAVWKARHMAQFKYMKHEDPAPPLARSLQQRAVDCGFTGGAAENIAMGYPTPADVMRGWLDSPGHRSNLEAADDDLAGMAAAIDTEGDHYWVQMFGASGGLQDEPPQEGGASPTAIEEDAGDPVDGSVNTPPIARRDRLAVKAGMRIREAVIINDNDPDGDSIRIVSVSPAKFGKARIHVETGSIIYRSRADAAGNKERLVYTIEDEFGATAKTVLILPIK